MSPENTARREALWCAIAALFFGAIMLCSLVAQVGDIPAVAPWRRRFPDFAEAMETLRSSGHLSHRFTAQVVLEQQILEAVQLLQRPRTAMESFSAVRSLEHIREALK